MREKINNLLLIEAQGYNKANPYYPQQRYVAMLLSNI